MSAGPEIPEGESKILGICATCGRPLTQVGPKGECLRCLVSLGFAAEESESGSEQHRSRLTPGAALILILILPQSSTEVDSHPAGCDTITLKWKSVPTDLRLSSG